MARSTDGKNDKLHFQMGRFVPQNGEWFYMTREDGEIGPFESKDEAKGDIVIYLRHQLKMQEFGS